MNPIEIDPSLGNQHQDERQGTWVCIMCLKLSFLELLVHVLEELSKDILWQMWVGVRQGYFQGPSSQLSNPDYN